MKAKVAIASFLLLAGTVGCDADRSSAQRATGARVAAPVAATGRAALGINLGSATYWSRERDFMNLAMGDQWRLAMNYRWLGAIDPARVDPVTGVIKALAPGETGVLMLTAPPPAPGGVVIRCTYEGKGSLSAGGNVKEVKKAPGGVEFRTMVDPEKAHSYWIILERTDPSDPVRSIDCREPGASKQALFSPEFLESLKPFGVLRFLDWQKINDNKGGRWAERTLPTSLTHGRRDGVAIEHMVALANAVDADPWFHIPYGADADYITRFARLVHDSVEPDRTVYIELSNEVWNQLFPAARQAQKEGLELKLSDVPYRAQLYRYAQKATAAYDIWSAVFADRPGKLVRVLGAQTANPWVAEQLLGFGDTAKHVDATATAPYFGFNRSTRPEDKAVAASVEGIMKILNERLVSTLDRDSETRAVAARYGKRHFAYEAGQHVLLAEDVAMLRTVQRDPRMEDLYRRYMAKWRGQGGDVMVLYNATAPTDQFGAWGLREYAGQPLAETPKRRAVLRDAAGH